MLKHDIYYLMLINRKVKLKYSISDFLSNLLFTDEKWCPPKSLKGYKMLNTFLNTNKKDK